MKTIRATSDAIAQSDGVAKNIINHSGLLVKYGSWAIPIIFIARTIGDFKYAGFFKKIKDTDFGKMDTQYYSPLCLIVGVISLIVKLL
jgi:Protein of unknown function (DUF3995)